MMDCTDCTAMRDNCVQHYRCYSRINTDFLSTSLLTYDCEGAKQNAHCRLDSWHTLQLLGSHFAVPSDVAGTHCH